MKTTNWQTKALTLFIAAAALWFTTACGNDDMNSAAQSIPEAETLIQEATKNDCVPPNIAKNSQEGEGMMADRNQGISENEATRIHKVRLKYNSLFWRQPNVHMVSEGLFRDESGDWMQEGGIVIRVSEKVSQDTLSPEDRIPECLEGVPIQIREEQPIRFR